MLVAVVAVEEEEGEGIGPQHQVAFHLRDDSRWCDARDLTVCSGKLQLAVSMD